MDAVSSYFLACFVCTALWIMIGAAVVGAFVPIVALPEPACPGWTWRRAIQWWLACAAMAVFAIPLQTTLYAFWGWWS